MWWPRVVLAFLRCIAVVQLEIGGSGALRTGPITRLESLPGAQTHLTLCWYLMHHYSSPLELLNTRRSTCLNMATCQASMVMTQNQTGGSSSGTVPGRSGMVLHGEAQRVLTSLAVPRGPHTYTQCANLHPLYHLHCPQQCSLGFGRSSIFSWSHTSIPTAWADAQVKLVWEVAMNGLFLLR